MTVHSKFEKEVLLVKGRIAELNASKALDLAVGGARLIDLRDWRDWTRENIVRALHIPRGVLERDIEACVPSLSSAVILFCDTGDLSLLAAHTLKRMGYQRVMVIAGGWSAVRKILRQYGARSHRNLELRTASAHPSPISCSHH